jgi:hypothetical protein
MIVVTAHCAGCLEVTTEMSYKPMRQPHLIEWRISTVRLLHNSFPSEAFGIGTAPLAKVHITPSGCGGNLVGRLWELLAAALIRLGEAPEAGRVVSGDELR